MAEVAAGLAEAEDGAAARSRRRCSTASTRRASHRLALSAPCRPQLRRRPLGAGGDAGADRRRGAAARSGSSGGCRARPGTLRPRRRRQPRLAARRGPARRWRCSRTSTRCSRRTSISRVREERRLAARARDRRQRRRRGGRGRRRRAARGRADATAGGGVHRRRGGPRQPPRRAARERASCGRRWSSRSRATVSTTSASTRSDRSAPASRVRGPGGHSWWDRGRPSALHALVSLLTVLLAEGTPAAPLNIGRVTGGGAINAIAAEAEATIEARSLDEAALDAFAAGLADLRLPAPLELTVEPLGRRPAGRIDRDASAARGGARGARGGGPARRARRRLDRRQRRARARHPGALDRLRPRPRHARAVASGSSARRWRSAWRSSRACCGGSSAPARPARVTPGRVSVSVSASRPRSPPHV